MRSLSTCLLLLQASKVLADAFTSFFDPNDNEGENHDPLQPPDGSEIKSIKIGDTGTTIPAYWSKVVDSQQQQATQAFIVIHGKLRDGNNYWGIMQKALTSAVQDGYPGVDSKAFVVAPQFFSERFNSGQYSDTDLAFADVNAWQAGDPAIHPANTQATSHDAVDAIISLFANQTEYPAMKNITVVGHGGGGQLIARYAQVGASLGKLTGNKDDEARVGLRYIVGDPSTNAYFTQDRPLDTSDGNFNNSCSFTNAWRYGFDNFLGTTHGHDSPFEYFSRYINRDIVFLIANNDTDANGDQSCPALRQGGVARRDRSLAWWAYINTLARSSEPVQLLANLTPNFKNLPNWSNVTKTPPQGDIVPKLILVEGAAHDPGQVLGSAEGRAALWNDMNNMPTGFRPDGWDNTDANCTFCDQDHENRAMASTGNGSDGTGTGAGGGGSESDSDDNGALAIARNVKMLGVVSMMLSFALLF